MKKVVIQYFAKKNSINKQNGGCASVTHILKLNNMKNLINYFTPRNAEERNTLGGLFAGLLILSIVFYFYSL